MSPSLRLGRCFLATHKLLVTKLSWARDFGTKSSFLSRSSKVTMFFWIVFGLALRKALVSFRHDLGFSANAHRHQVSFGFSFISSRLVPGYRTLWALVHHHHSLGCEFDYSVTQHSPLCTNCLWWVLILPFMMSYVFLYLLCRSRMLRRSAMKYKSSTSSLFIDAGLGATLGGN